MKYEIERLFEKILLGIVWILPKKLVYLSSIRLMANATCGKYSDQIVPDLTCTEALKRWVI